MVTQVLESARVPHRKGTSWLHRILFPLWAFNLAFDDSPGTGTLFIEGFLWFKPRLTLPEAILSLRGVMAVKDAVLLRDAPPAFSVTA